MNVLVIFCGLLGLAVLSRGQESGPATSPSGTVCESPGGSCVGLANGVSIQYKGDCGRYIVCFLECGWDMDCPSGLHFNKEFGICDYPWNAGCDISATSPTLPTVATPATPSPATPSPATPSPATPSPATPSPATPSPATPSPATPSPATPSPATPSPATPSPATPSPATPTPSTPNVCESAGASCKGFETGTLLPYNGNCARFVECLSECGVDFDCPSGLYFNPITRQCDSPENAGCTSSDTIPPVACSPAGASCTGQETGTLQPYNGNCSRYVSCLDGCGVDMDCPPGLYFNNTSKRCDWPENAGCTIDGSIPPVACSPAGTSCVGNETDTLLPYSGNCSRYVFCLGGCGVDMDCPPGLYFNNGIKKCDWPENAGCTIDGSIPPVACSPAGASCVGNETGTLLPYSRNCSRYVFCLGGCGVDMDCPPGLYFNKGIKQCDWPENAGCTSSDSIPPVACSPAGASCTGQETGTLQPYNGNCSRYVSCLDGCGVDMDCPPGLYFNNGIKQCDWPENAGCTFDGSIPPVACSPAGASCVGNETGTLLPYSGNCSRYVSCLDGCGVDMDCPPGLYFNKGIKQCDWPKNAGCTSSDSIPPVACSPAGASCTGQETGTLQPYNGNCSRYVSCLDGCGVDMDCPSGLEFNNKTKRCDYPEVANCSSGTRSGSIPSPGPDSGSSPGTDSGSAPPGEGPCSRGRRLINGSCI